VIFRENTEDLYAGLEVMVQPDIAQSLKIITAKGSTRIARAAFEYARKHGRKKVHAIHKANIMKLTDGLFLRCCKAVAAEFPEIQYLEHIVDNACMQLVLNPYQYDVILTENLYGDILSDLCSAFVGGLGLVPGANIGADAAIFEAVHGSAPDIAGQDKANPTALLQSAVLMLHHIGEPETAGRIQKALNHVYAEGKTLTRDVGGTVGTRAFTEAVLTEL
jgi:isocitrate dehydrogenase (NAD+)